MIQIIDNFLPEEEFKSIQSFMMGGQFKWIYSEGRSYEDDGLFLMVHMFYQPDVGTNSEHINIWNNFMSKIGAKECIRIKANLTFKTPTIQLGPYHHDYDDKKTAVFYLNTNNGYTKFKNGTKVKSVENRMIVFPSNLEHQGYTCSDQLNRVVVNFNYDK